MSDDRDAPSPEPAADLTPFSRWHALVARARRLTDLDALISHPTAELLVQATPAQDLFFAIKQVGLADAQELLELCLPRQIQTFIDLDVWRRDRVEGSRLGPWLESLLAARPEILSRALSGLDPEVWVLALQPHVRVYDYSLEQADAFGEEQTVLQSPDNIYLVEIVDPESKGGELAARLCTHFFKVETPDVWRRFLESVRLEIPGELEESAYRFRAGRLADLGFVEFQDAIEAFAWLDPRRLKENGVSARAASVGKLPEVEGARLPAPYARALADDSFLARVLGRVADEEALENLTHALVGLANRVLVVDDIDVGELELVQASAARMRAYLSMALEFLGDGDAAAAEPWLRGLRLIELHRVGFSLTLELKRRADRLAREGWLAREGARPTLLAAAERELLTGLRRRRPVLFAGLGDASRVDHRDFESLSDVRAAARALDAIELQGWLFLDVLGVEPSTLPPSLDFGALVRSAVVHEALGQGFRCASITAQELGRFVERAMAPAPEGDVRVLTQDLRDETTLYLEGLVTERGADARALVRALARDWMDELEAELTGLPPGVAPDPRFVAGLWLAIA